MACLLQTCSVSYCTDVQFYASLPAAESHCWPDMNLFIVVPGRLRLTRIENGLSTANDPSLRLHTASVIRNHVALVLGP